MKKVFKYELHAEYIGSSGLWDDKQVVEIPCGAKVLSVGVQADKAVMWALVNPDAPKEKRTIYITNTGGELGDEFGGRRFIGTLIFGGGGIVFHVWE